MSNIKNYDFQRNDVGGAGGLPKNLFFSVFFFNKLKVIEDKKLETILFSEQLKKKGFRGVLPFLNIILLKTKNKGLSKACFFQLL